MFIHWTRTIRGCQSKIKGELRVSLTDIEGQGAMGKLCIRYNKEGESDFNCFNAFENFVKEKKEPSFVLF
jgi:hypothetical protein